ncbi:MAG: alpha/beta hydrolase [Nitrososphaeraceae archaeon]
MTISKADILGYSMSSIIAQELTLMDPDRVDSLVLMHQTAMAKKRFLQVQRLSKPLPIVPMKRE